MGRWNKKCERGMNYLSKVNQEITTKYSGLLFEAFLSDPQHQQPNFPPENFKLIFPVKIEKIEPNLIIVPNFPKILTSHFPDLKIFPKFWLND